MGTVLNLWGTLLRKLTPAEVDANFINLRTTADGAATALGGFAASQTPGANQIPVTAGDSSLKLPGNIIAPLFSTSFSSYTVSDNTSMTMVSSKFVDYSTWLITVVANGINLVLNSTALLSVGEGNCVANIVALSAGVDYQKGAITFQTYNNLAVSSFSAMNGGKFQVVLCNQPLGAGDVTFNITCTRIA